MNGKGARQARRSRLLFYLSSALVLAATGTIGYFLISPLIDDQPFLHRAQSMVGASEKEVRRRLGPPVYVLRLSDPRYPIEGYAPPPPILADYALVYHPEKSLLYLFFDEQGRLVYVHRSPT